jgi:hypothetical protein
MSDIFSRHATFSRRRFRASEIEAFLGRSFSQSHFHAADSLASLADIYLWLFSAPIRLITPRQTFISAFDMHSFLSFLSDISSAIVSASHRI